MDSYTIISLIIMFVFGIVAITINKPLTKYFVRQHIARLKKNYGEQPWIVAKEGKLEKQMSKILYVGGGIFLTLAIFEIILTLFFPGSDSALTTNNPVSESERYRFLEWWWRLAGKVIFLAGFLYVLKYYGYLKWPGSKK